MVLAIPTHLVEVEDEYEQIQMYRRKDNAQDSRVNFAALRAVFRGGRQCGAAHYRSVFALPLVILNVLLISAPKSKTCELLLP
jgi:hypothetical protein